MQIPYHLHPARKGAHPALSNSLCHEFRIKVGPIVDKISEKAAKGFEKAASLKKNEKVPGLHRAPQVHREP